MQLTAAGFGAPVLATFANGRAEAWVHARPLEPAEFADPVLSPRIARLLRRFHAARVDGPAEAALWPLLRSWLAMAAEIRLDDPARQAKLGRVSIASLSDEVAQLEAACAALASPVVYCHNDLLAPNLLLEDVGVEGAEARAAAKATAPLHVIDFEYGGYNYRGFDLGNHFNEWAGFDCEYERYVNGLLAFRVSTAACAARLDQRVAALLQVPERRAAARVPGGVRGGRGRRRGRGAGRGG